MSTENNHYEKGPFGHRYIIHLQENDEVCLHALSILQADLIGCYLPIYKNYDENTLVVDISGCIPLGELKGKNKSYVQRHYRTLFSTFFSEMLRSLNHALPLNGICCLEEHLYYNQYVQKIMCIYLPIRSKLQGQKALLSSFEENAFDELLRIPYDRKWITPRATEELYRLFRSDDECSVSAFIKNKFWEYSQAIPKTLKQTLSFWVLLLISFILFSSRIAILFRGTILAVLPDLLFFVASGFVCYSVFSFSRQNTKAKNAISKNKQQRRKTRNAQMLFPIENTNDNASCTSSDTLIDPILFQEIGPSDGNEKNPHRFTIWTNEFVVGEDSDCCDYSIDHHHLSLKHAIFIKDPSGLYVQDLDSKSGTFVNRKRLMKNEKVYLEDGDILGLGDVEFRTCYFHGVM
ncbi:MAG: FHA domain-containing protein [Clostridiales bacterium]|nr:FHA domain-containing protein [Clostridiales bacterium]